MLLGASLHCSWECLPDKDDTYVTCIMPVLFIYLTVCFEPVNAIFGMLITRPRTGAGNFCGFPACHLVRIDVETLPNMLKETFRSRLASIIARFRFCVRVCRFPFSSFSV